MQPQLPHLKRMITAPKWARRACEVLAQGQYIEILCVNCCYLSEVQGWRKKGDLCSGSRRWRGNQVTVGQKLPLGTAGRSGLFEEGLELQMTFCIPGFSVSKGDPKGNDRKKAEINMYLTSVTVKELKIFSCV